MSTLKNTNQTKKRTTTIITSTAKMVASQLGNLAFSSAVTRGRTRRKMKNDIRILMVTAPEILQMARLVKTSNTVRIILMVRMFFSVFSVMAP